MSYVKHEADILFKDYNKSVTQWFQDNLLLPFYDPNENIKILYSTPDKAWDTVNEHLINGSYPAPIGGVYCSLMNLNEQLTPGGYVYREYLIKNDDGSPRLFPDGNYYYFQEYAASIYELSYNFTCWAMYKRDLNYIFTKLLKKTTKRRPAAWKLHGHWVILKNNSMINIESDLEPGSGKNRVLRWSMEFTIDNAVLPGPYKFVPAVKGVSANIESN